MTLVESRSHELIKTRTDMIRPLEGTSESKFSFWSEGGETAVTWTIAGHHNFIGKALCLVMDGKTMLGNVMKKGLARMKEVAKAAAGP